jgi:mannose-6-phosphate isomerase-like protein (cupin superfamily)
VLFAETPPGAGPPLHVHARDDELFVVLEGTISFFGPSGGWTATQSGTVVYAPRGVAHTFRNTGSTPSRHLVVTSPSGFEEFYTRAAAVFASGSADAPAVLGGLAAEYGYTILGPAPGDG